MKKNQLVAELYIDEILLGILYLEVADLAMGALSGMLIPGENYQRFKNEFQQITESKGLVNSDDFNLNVRIENNLKLEPEGGIALYDFKKIDEIQVDVAGLDSDVISKYFQVD